MSPLYLTQTTPTSNKIHSLDPRHSASSAGIADPTGDLHRGLLPECLLATGRRFRHGGAVEQLNQLPVILLDVGSIQAHFHRHLPVERKGWETIRERRRHQEIKRTDEQSYPKLELQINCYKR